MRFIKSASIVATLSLAALAVGCQDKKMAAQNKALWQENQDLTARLNDAESRLATAPDAGTFASLQSELAAREARINELEQALQQENPGIDGIETSYDAKTNTLTVNLPGDVLFSAGSAQIKKTSQTTLDKIATALTSDYSGKKVRVEGHTDADPITKTKKIWADNLDLSLNRAAAVTRYLESKGVDPKNIVTAGYGPYQPKGDQKAQNRRVEIVVQLDQN